MSSNGLLAAVQWIEQLMLGPIATMVATIAVAIIGLLLLNGWVDWKRATNVMFGCFLIFGAPLIAAGLLESAGVGGAPARSAEVNEPDIVPPPPPRAEPYDPYAGAALPTNW